MRQTDSDTGARYAGQAVILFGTLAILYFARGILIPLAFALILAFLLTPAVTLLKRVGIGRVPAVLLAVFIVTAAVGICGWVIANQLIDVANQLPRYRQNIDVKIASLHMPASGALAQAARSLQEIGKELTQGPNAEARPTQVTIVAPDTNELTAIWNLAQPTLVPIASTGVVVIFAIFALIEKEDLRDRLLRLAGTGQLNIMTEALDDAAKRISRYLLMQLLVNAAFGLFTGVGLYLMGVPYAALWGIIAGVLRIVPYVGTLVATVIPLAFSLVIFNGWMQPVLVFSLFAVAEITTANFVEPLLYGAHTGISSLALLVTIVFWGAIWGPPGLILSTPLTVCLVVMGRYIPQLAFLHILLGDEPALEPAAQVYQRLLAMDQHDARVVVDAFMKDASLAQLYDAVLVPALGLAEHDRHRGAIDSARENFLFLNINEMVAEFSEYEAAAPRSAGCRVLCIPAHDQADEIVAAMLAQLLEREGCVALSFPAGEALEEVLELIQPEAGDLICVSALPPFAFAPARNMCRRIRARFPGLKIIAGVWGFAGDSKKALARFDRTPPDHLFTRFGEVVDYVRSEGK